MSDPALVNTELVLQRRFGVSSGSGQTVSAAGDTTVYTPAAGRHIRLKWTGWNSPSTNSAPTLVAMRFGANAAFYKWSMEAPGAFAHGTVREGAADEKLIVNLSAAQTVYINFDLEEF